MSRALVAILAAVATLVGVFIAGVLIVDSSHGDQIAGGIRIASVDVGGLNVEQARGRVQRALAGSIRRPVSVSYHSRRFVLSPEQAHVSLDVAATVEAARRRGRAGSDAFSRVLGGGDVNATIAPRIVYSRAAVEAFAERVAKRVDSPAKDADIDIRHGRLLRRRARNGVSVERPQLAIALARRLTAAPAGRELALPVKVTERPQRTLADLASQYPTVIAVNRAAKRLRLYKRLRLAHTYTVAVGMQGLETAAGRYTIQEKIVNPPWHVPMSAWAGSLAGKTIPAGDPQNPLKARWMGFHDGQGIHGTSELASLGTAASHGCIRMAVPDVEALYDQVKVGTPLFLQ